MNKQNIFQNLPDNLSTEVLETILQSSHIRIERIISHGQSSAESFWYDQAEHEWIMVLQGSAAIRFEDGLRQLNAGDYLLIPAHQKHRVEWTQADSTTIWLCIFYT